MGLYDQRKTELNIQVTELFEQLDSGERLYLPLAIGNYTNAVHNGLEALLRILEDTRLDLLKSQWEEQIKTMRAALAQTIGDVFSANSSSKPSAAAADFRVRVLIEEHRFLNGLDAKNIGFMRDLLIAHQTNLEDYTQILNKKWSTISDQNSLISEGERRILEETQKAMDEAAKQVAATRREILEHLAASIVYLNDLPKKIPVGGGLAKKFILEWIGGHATLVAKVVSNVSKVLKYLLEKNPWFKQRVATYKNTIETHSNGVLVVYRQTREDAEEFVRDNGFEKAKQYYSDARDALERWQSDVSTPAQKACASEFTQGALSRLSNHLSKTERTFNTFVSTHQFKFFGPLGPDIREALAQEKMWEYANAGMRSTDLESRLREWYREPVDVWAVDLERAFSYSEAEIANLPPDVKAEVEVELKAHKERITRLVREHTEQLVRAMEEAREVTKTDTLADAFNRTRLVKALTR